MKLESKKRVFDMRLTQGYKIEANSTHGLWHVENPENPSMFYERAGESPRPCTAHNEDCGVLNLCLFKVALIHQVNAPCREFLRGSPEVHRCSLALKSPSCVGNNKEISEAAAPGPLI